MKRQTKILFFILSLITISSFGQVQLLKKYDFNKGGFSMLGIRSESDRNSFVDSVGEFFIDDIKVLNSIKKEWSFVKPSPIYACGYHYQIILCENGIAVESFLVNLNCNEIVCDSGYFYFEPSQLKMFKKGFKKAYRKEKKFSSLPEMRNFIAEILLDSNLILTPSLSMIKFEGSFKFTFVCDKENQDCLNIDGKLLNRIAKEIKEKFPDEQFELEDAGGSGKTLIVEVKCNKSFSDKFTLFNRDLQNDKWTPSDMILTSFWKAR